MLIPALLYPMYSSWVWIWMPWLALIVHFLTSETLTEHTLLESSAWRRATACVVWVWLTTPLSLVGNFSSHWAMTNWHLNGYCGETNNLLCHAGILLLSGFETDVSEAKALLHQNNKIDIYSNSWGPFDSGSLVLGPDLMATMALEQGAQQVKK